MLYRIQVQGFVSKGTWKFFALLLLQKSICLFVIRYFRNNEHSSARIAVFKLYCTHKCHSSKSPCTSEDCSSFGCHLFVFHIHLITDAYKLYGMKEKKEWVKNLGLLQRCYKNVDRLWKMMNQNELATIVAIFIQPNRYKTCTANTTNTN